MWKKAGSRLNAQLKVIGVIYNNTASYAISLNRLSQRLNLIGLEGDSYAVAKSSGHIGSSGGDKY
jgi:hypothetical protein